MVLGYIEGTLLSDVQPSDAGWVQIGSTLGMLTGALREYAHPAAGRTVVWDMRHFMRMSALADSLDNPRERSLADAVIGDYAKLAVPRLRTASAQVIHGDLSPFNIVVAPGDPSRVLGVIDFGDMVRTSVLFDVTVAMSNTLDTESSDPWAVPCELLSGYLRTQPLPDEQVLILRETSLGRLLLRALISRRRSERVPGSEAYLMSHARCDWDRLEHAMAVPAASVRERLLDAARSTKSLEQPASIDSHDLRGE